MSVPANDWNNRLKDFISGLAGLIPKVGGIIKFLLSQFWPTSYDDIWKLLEKKIESLIYQIVDQEILKHELAERQSELAGLEDSMKQYVDAKIHEKGHWMIQLLGTANTFYEELDGSLNDVHFLPIMITLAYLHLSLLKERLLHGKEIFEEDNTDQWKKELEEYLEKYQKLFLSKWPKWSKWRYEQIDLNYYTKRPGPVSPTDAYCDITDKSSKKKKWQYFAEADTTDRLKPGVNMLRDRIFGEIKTGMLSAVYIPSFLLGQFIPGHEKDAPVADKSVGIIQLGPFSVATGDDGHTIDDFLTFEGSLTNDPPGEITKMAVREYNSIDGMQMYYKGHDGTFVGNPGGGELHSFSLADNVSANYVYMEFAQGLLDLVQFKFSDQTDTGKLGNRGGWQPRYTVILDITKMLDENFILRGVNMQSGDGPSSTTGVANVVLVFYHKSLL